MAEGINPQTANLLREATTQSQPRNAPETGQNQSGQQPQNSGANNAARPAPDVSVQISQQGFDAASGGENIQDPAAADTNTASTFASADFGGNTQAANENAGPERADGEVEQGSADNSPVAGQQSVAADDSLGTNIDVEA